MGWEQAGGAHPVQAAVWAYKPQETDRLSPWRLRAQTTEVLANKKGYC